MNEKIKKEFAAGLIKLLDVDDATAKKDCELYRGARYRKFFSKH